MNRAVVLLLALCAVAACDRSKLDEDKYQELGAAAVLPFKKSLKAALVAGLQDGPVNAVSVCRMEAPALAARASTLSAKVGRTSRKLRNPANAPKPWMVPLLERYESDPNAREPAVVAIDRNTVGYVEAIYLQPLCVTCHGPASALAPDLKAKLDELYPNDQATGYAAGDFRGVFWAELTREE